MFNIMDAVNIGLKAIVCTIEFIILTLFISEWIRLRKASQMFEYITILLVCLLITDVTELYAKYLRMYHSVDSFLGFLHTCIWNIRDVPVIVILVCLLKNVLNRISIRKKEEEK